MSSSGSSRCLNILDNFTGIKAHQGKGLALVLLDVYIFLILKKLSLIGISRCLNKLVSISGFKGPHSSFDRGRNV